MFTNELTINRPKADVFEYLADVERAPSWYSAVAHVTELDVGKARAGKRYLFERWLGRTHTVNEVEIADWEPDRTISLRSLSGPTPFTYRFTLEERDGSTHLRLDGEISGAGLSGLPALAAPFAERAFARGMRANLQALKAQLEHEPKPRHAAPFPGD